MPFRLPPILTLLLVIAFVSAQDASQRATAKVEVVNAISIAAGEVIEFLLGPDEGQRNATTRVEFTTNDGNTYSIMITSEPGGWTFSPAVPGSASSAFPVLRFDSSNSTVGKPSLAPAVLIDQTNAVGAGAEIVSGISSSAGSVEVTLEVQSGPGVVAGSYRTRLDYTFTAP